MEGATALQESEIEKTQLAFFSIERGIDWGVVNRGQ
jgi:hypothetical protein